ncbi:MAG: LuxR C-terminal-related transcriptional regulator [Gammaproteobacteria bacterium]|nr:LuxR C-terminal-related transcriptional regulator [Gammaproteobacteria bacterium]
MIKKILNCTSNILIFAKDINSRYLFCNEAAAKAAGLDSPKQIIGKSDDDLYWREHASLYQYQDKEALQGKILINKQLPITSVNKIETILLSEASFLNNKGFNAGVVCHAVDITGYTITKNNGYIDIKKNTFFLGENFNDDYFTRREFEVFKYLLQGCPVDEIALKTGRSSKTIQTQIKHVTKKLQCNHKSEIVPTAMRQGLTHVLGDLHFIRSHSKEQEFYVENTLVE